MIFNSCLFVFISSAYAANALSSVKHVSCLDSMIILVDICFMLLTANNFPIVVNTYKKSFK